MNFKLKISVIVLILFSTIASFSQDWKTILENKIPEYGHRNWIIIADAAYPKQSAPGIETIVTNAKQLEVIKEVLAQINKASHIKPVIMFDAELDLVPEKNATGVEAYKKELNRLLKKQPAKEMPHEDIIQKLDESSKLFNVLLLKTNMTIPYTSVFIELDCGYWSTEKEKELRNKIQQK